MLCLSDGFPQLRGEGVLLLVSSCHLLVYTDLSRFSSWTLSTCLLLHQDEILDNSFPSKKGKVKSKGKKRSGIKVEIFLTMSTLFSWCLLFSPTENVIWYGVYKKDALKSLHKLAVHLFIHISPWLTTYHHETPQATHKKKSRHKSNYMQFFPYQFSDFFFSPPSVIHIKNIYFPLITHRGNTIPYIIITLFIQ